MKKNRYMRIVLDDDLLFLKSLNGVGTVFNRVFRRIFDEIRASGEDGITTWNALVEGRIGITILLETEEGLCKSRVKEAMGKERRVKRGVTENGEGQSRKHSSLEALMARVRNFDLE
ncbi:hypothetical protein Thein_1926 [Thermodesulfatator indicus DSM 15286]|uniref:Uncharacterized protein n=1 Tax=Thermodesulfatator indicus (strain DSM 15286 / JCM 11887 / CIR29812) TaxID=667014 RepID=F8ACK6_THEID|nr:hypothetical protein [Thermodesulfatator indicus]AEH45781.1 hypothetical protein Thein_1926 [Thermodesulfatator indicus DSM 15286]